VDLVATSILLNGPETPSLLAHPYARG